MALSCAAVDDVAGWCILAFVVAIANARAGSHPGAVLTHNGGGAGEGLTQATYTVGLTAGTSTLPETIAAVRAHLETFYPDPFAVHGVPVLETHDAQRASPAAN